MNPLRMALVQQHGLQCFCALLPGDPGHSIGLRRVALGMQGQPLQDGLSQFLGLVPPEVKRVVACNLAEHRNVAGDDRQLVPGSLN
jgi:hypothetical protein